MNPRLLEISRTRHNWHNATNNVISTPLRFFYPEDAEDIREIVLEAEHEKVRVRAVGSGHSYSEVALCKDFLLDMKKIHGVEKYEAPWVKASVPSGKHFRAGGGRTDPEAPQPPPRGNEARPWRTWAPWISRPSPGPS
jgi:FAD/FMN-containing dehydrogenase